MHVLIPIFPVNRSRKAATAAAVSALLSAGMPGRADALFGRGKKPEPLPSAPAIERRVEEAVDGLAEASEELVSVRFRFRYLTRDNSHCGFK